MTMLNTFWKAARTHDADVAGEGRRAGTAEGELGERFRRAGLLGVVEGALEARVQYADFADFWEPFTFAVGPAGQHLASLPADKQAQIRASCQAALPGGAFSLTARAWYARGTVAGRRPR